MKVQKFEIQNYKALSGKREIIPEGSSFFLIGGNGQGKTSAGRSLVDMLTKSFPSKPITEGAEEGFIEVTFDDESKLAVKFEDGKKPKITFLTSEGHKAATPREFFQQMAGNGMGFNIDKFLSLAPKPRREMLEKMVGVDLSFFNAREADLMEKAKYVRLDVEGMKYQVKKIDEKLLEAELIDIKELSEKISQTNKRRVEIRQWKDAITRSREEIRRLEMLIKSENEKIKEAESQLSDIDPVDEFELAVWEDNLSKADEKNTEIREAKRQKVINDQYDKAIEKLFKIEGQIKEVREEKEEAIKSKPLPADGMTFDPDGDGILLNDLPFEDEQVASSAKVIAALQIAAAQLGEVRYLHFDAAYLDKDNAFKVLTWAENNDLQLCMELPVWEPESLKMEVYDLTAKGLKKTKSENV